MIRPLALLALALTLVSPLAAEARLAREATQGVREALADSKRGRSERALALLSSLLLTNNARVGVDEGSLPKGSREAFRRGMERGVRTWREAMPEAPFALSRPREEPDVVVRFVPRIDVTEDVQGMIEAKRELRWDRKGYGYRLRAVLLVREETDGRLLTENEVASVVAHELGHLLGLDDTGRVRELMGPFVPGFTRARPTDDEVTLVRDYRIQLRQTMDQVRDAR